MKAKYILLIIVSCAIFYCCDEEDRYGSYAFPDEVAIDSIWQHAAMTITLFDFKSNETVYYGNTNPINGNERYKDLVRFSPDNEQVNKENLCILIGTTSPKDDYKAPQKPELKAKFQTLYSQRFSSHSTMWGVNIVGQNGYTITADRTLFGRTAGGDLSDHFRIKAYIPDCIVSYPQFDVIYDFGKPKPLLLSEYSKSKSTSQFIYIMYDTPPEEDYDSVTFTIAQDLTDGRTLSGSIKVLFATK